MCYKEGDIVQVFARGSQTLLHEVKITTKTCDSMFVRLMFFRYEMEKGTYTHRKKRI